MEINKFRGKYCFLSNMYPSKLTVYGLSFESAEAAFQAMKTLNMDERKGFTSLSATAAKKHGRAIKLRPDWEEVKDEVMEQVLRAKFSVSEMAQQLLDTGDALLIEGNPYGDTYWGVCNGIGQNRLGQLLMKIRTELRRATRKRRLFVDLDGTVAEWREVKEFEELYEPGYFSSLRPYQQVIDAIRLAKESLEDIEVYTLSAIVPDSPYAVHEKTDWIERHMPFVQHHHQLFTAYGEPKTAFIPGGIRSSDVLLDDYTVNLMEWSKYAKAIKLLNGINGTKGTWKGPCVSRYAPASVIAETILSFIRSEEQR